MVLAQMRGSPAANLCNPYQMSGVLGERIRLSPPPFKHASSRHSVGPRHSRYSSHFPAC